MNDIIDDAFNDTPDVPLRTPQEGEDSNSFGQFGALQVGGLGAKALRTDDQGLWLGAFKFVDAPFSVSMAGAIIATSGTIAGWSINATTIFKNNATLDSAGQITLGTTDDVAILSSVNTTYRLWIGDATAGDAAFSVTKGGALLATSATITGTIYANAGTIGGFTITTYLYAGTGTNTVGLSPGDYPFWAGATYSNRATAPFRVNTAGDVTCNNAYITGTSSLNLAQIAGGTGTGAKIQWSGGSKIWEDTSAKMGFNAIGGEVYFYLNNTEVMFLGASNVNLYQHLHVTGIDLSIGGGSPQNEGSINNVDFINGYNDLRFYAPTSDYIFYKNGDNTDVVARFGGATGRLETEASTMIIGGHTVTVAGDVTIG